MSASQQGGSAQPATWTEPPWSGWIETTGDALLILEAARRGIIPRVTRRLVDSERKMITSGSVFVFDEDESGIKRWTDGFFWSPSRILGNFLLYRETEKKGTGHRGRAGAEDASDQSQYNVEGVKLEGQTLSRPKSDVNSLGVDRQRERSLVGSLTNTYKFKPNGLMKKTFSLTIGGVAQHLISYYRVEDVENGRLRSPSSLPELASLDISPEYLDRTHFRIAPKVEIGIDGLPRYRGEADDIETSPQPLSAPLATGLPLLTDGRVAEGSVAKRTKRYDPYGSPPMQKRARKSLRDSSSTDDEQQSEPQASTSAAALPSPDPHAISQPPAAYPDPNVAAVPPAPYPYAMPGFYQMPPGYPMYPAGVYPPPPAATSGAGPPPAPSHAQYPYPSAYPPPPPPTGSDPSMGTYYPYYHPPPSHPPPAPYPGYPLPWHYASYASHPAPQQPPVGIAPVDSQGKPVAPQQVGAMPTPGDQSHPEAS